MRVYRFPDLRFILCVVEWRHRFSHQCLSRTNSLQLLVNTVTLEATNHILITFSLTSIQASCSYRLKLVMLSRRGAILVTTTHIDTGTTADV